MNVILLRADGWQAIYFDSLMFKEGPRLEPQEVLSYVANKQMTSFRDFYVKEELNEAPFPKVLFKSILERYYDETLY